MFREAVRYHIWALVLLSAGGLLLHLRIHPPAESLFFWVPALVAGLNVFVVPWLFNYPRTAPVAYAFTVLTVVVGTVTMAWFSATHLQPPITFTRIVLNTTLQDILILGARLPVAYAIMLHYRARAGEQVRRDAVAPVGAEMLTGAAPLPGPDEIVRVGAMAPGLRLALRAVFALIGLGVVIAAAWAGLREFGELHEYAEGLGTAGAVALLLGRTCGLLAGALTMLQFPLSARLGLLDRAFGLDRLMRCHRYVGAGAAVLAVLHPALVFAPDAYVLGPLSLQRWPILLGLAALTMLVGVVTVSLWRAFLGIPYHIWRRLHYGVFLIVALVGAHSLLLGHDLRGGWPRSFWLALIGAYVLLFLWARLLRPLLNRSWYDVAQVNRVSHNTWEIVLTPRGRGRPANLPGQFGFLRLKRGGRLQEEHPFTISSAPTGEGLLRFTIKESGDYTATIGETRPGDGATVAGPYGDFSHLIRGGDDLLMIAGGVGITPLLSMLRYMAATGDGRRIKLVWGNRTEADILLRDEIRRLAERLALTVVHVMSRQDDFNGPTGLLDRAVLATLLDERDLRSEVYLCGPPPMMKLVQAALRELGVPTRAINSERFEL